ncbi:hypothetical protein BDW75DRAFT_161165 [Aspergillus navahoensis]
MPLIRSLLCGLIYSEVIVAHPPDSGHGPWQPFRIETSDPTQSQHKTTLAPTPIKVPEPYSSRSQPTRDGCQDETGPANVRHAASLGVLIRRGLSPPHSPGCLQCAEGVRSCPGKIWDYQDA